MASFSILSSLQAPRTNPRSGLYRPRQQLLSDRLPVASIYGILNSPLPKPDTPGQSSWWFHPPSQRHISPHPHPDLSPMWHILERSGIALRRDRMAWPAAPVDHWHLSKPEKAQTTEMAHPSHLMSRPGPDTRRGCSIYVMHFQEIRRGYGRFQ